MKTSVLLTLFVIGLNGIFAQDTLDQTSIYKNHLRLNSPLTYLTLPFAGDLQWRPSFTNYILTADVAPHFFLFTESNTNFALDIFTDIKIRILRANSLPVRTPSFKAGATIHYQLGFIQHEDIFDYLSFTFKHHSNGQDGCPLFGYEKDSDDLCLNAGIPNPDNRIFNQANGNFSTNFFELGYNISTQKQDSSTKTLGWYVFRHEDSEFIGEKYHHFYIGYQYHFTGIEPELIGRYAKNQLSIKYQRTTAAYWKNSDVRKFEADRLVLELNTNLSRMERFENFRFINRFSLEARYNFTVRKLASNSTSLFVMAGYKGQDDYNIYLEDSYAFIGCGISAGSIIYSLSK